jgi:HlyD family secretion protein
VGIAESELDSAQALHDSAAAQLDATKAKEQSLAAGIGSAQAQLRVTEAMLKAAQAVVEQKRAALRQSQVDLEHTRITAPVDGVVVSRAVDVGQTVAASLQAPVLFTIAQDLTKMQVDTSVDEADIGRIKLSDRTTFTVDAFPGETFVGSVTQIRKAPQVVQNVVTYTVVVAVDNPTGKLLPGMTANVKLVYAEKPNVLKVSNAGLRFRPAGAEGGPGGAPKLVQ